MATLAQDRTLAAPVIYPDNTEFWAATAQGQLLVRHCEACGKPHWHPRTHCPLCMSDQVVWKPSAGQGQIYTFSVCRRVGPVPYAIAYVRLDEGVTLMTNIVDCDLDTLAIGQRVQLVFKEAEGGAQVPMFKPV